MISEFCIKWQKDIDNVILGEIKEKAIEHGIKNEYILNEKAIISALKKHIPKKVIHAHNHHKHFCSTCHEPIKVGAKYCGTCGKKIDWSDTK